MHFNNHNNLIYKVHNVEKISSWRRTETDRVSERPKVRLKPTFNSYCSRSFDKGKDYIAYLGQGRSDGGILVYIPPYQSLEIILCTNCSRSCQYMGL